MKYYSTNGKAPLATLEQAVLKGLAEDRGLYMPLQVKPLGQSFWDEIDQMTFHEIAYHVADNFFGEDVTSASLEQIVYETLSFDVPAVRVTDHIYSLEMFHGPTLAFKDVGARFMARLLQYFLNTGTPHTSDAPSSGKVNVLVATSGDTGSAVANGFLGVEGIHVYVLYPKGKVSPIQESQFTTLGHNITAIAVEGTFDDCQSMVKKAFADETLNARTRLTSANSINVARFLPQSFYYFWAYAQLKKILSPRQAANIVVSVPSGNLGNICSALFGKRMGLPIKRFIAANNTNDVFFRYLQTGLYTPSPGIPTIANAMDVGAPSNYARIHDLYGGDHDAIAADVSGATYTDARIAEAMRRCLRETGYQLDPHGACGYQALKDGLRDGETGIFLETAHPAKFKQVVDDICGGDIAIPGRLQAFMNGTRRSVGMTNDFAAFREYLLSQE